MNLTLLSPVSVTAKDSGGCEGTEGPRPQDPGLILGQSCSGKGPLWQLPEACAQADSGLGSSWSSWPQPKLKVLQACRERMGWSFLADMFAWSTCTSLTVARRCTTKSSHNFFSGSTPPLAQREGSANPLCLRSEAAARPGQ